MTVDPSGNADESTIQAGITACDPTQGQWTVLIYAGVYTQAITLDGEDENIDLVGIDRDTVIIAPTAGSGIKITSGTETVRNNVIRNLTIKPTDGIGVEIVRGGGGSSVPKDIIIDGVTISAAGSGNAGILAEEVAELTISNSTISSAAGRGIHLDTPTSGTDPENVSIISCTVIGDGSGNSGIDAVDANAVTIINSTVTSGDAVGIVAGRNMQIRFCTVRGNPDAVAQLAPGGRAVVQHSVLNARAVTESVIYTSPPATPPSGRPAATAPPGSKPSPKSTPNARTPAICSISSTNAEPA